MTNEQMNTIFVEEYNRLISGGCEHRLAQLGALDKLYEALYREFQNVSNILFERNS